MSAAAFLSTDARADQPDKGKLTYTYDITGAHDDAWWVTPYSWAFDQVDWSVTSRTSDEPYRLDGLGGGSSYRRKQDYPASVMCTNRAV